MSTLQIVAFITVALLLGIVLGWFGYSQFADIASECKIVYVAEEELIELERARVEREVSSPEKQQLFFGNIDKAIELTIKIAASKNNKKTRVIFGLSPVFTDGVESISREVHQKVIAELARAAGKEPRQ